MNYNSTEQTVSWFYQRASEGTLVLNPPFQRRPVWTRRQQSHLVESILMGLPIPEIYLQQRTKPDGTTQHVVVDGQQRITAVLQFIGTDSEEGFELQYLSEDSAWGNRALTDLTEEEKSRFFGHRLAVRMLDNVTDEEVKDLFRRLNKYLTKLSAQELRNATYSGPFVKLAENLAEDPYWVENRIVSPQGIRRMGDIEFVSELVIGVMHGPQGGSAKTLDDYYAQYEGYETEIPDQASARRRFGRTLDTIQEVLPDIKVIRWHNKTDFYTLFVAVAHMLRDHTLPERQQRPLATSLAAFAHNISMRLSDEAADVPDTAVRYVRAVEKGSSDKSRRAARHQAMLEVISQHFRRRRAA
jgi:hypothetical protein